MDGTQGSSSSQPGERGVLSLGAPCEASGREQRHWWAHEAAGSSRQQAKLAATLLCRSLPASLAALQSAPAAKPIPPWLLSSVKQQAQQHQQAAAAAAAAADGGFAGGLPGFKVEAAEAQGLGLKHDPGLLDGLKDEAGLKQVCWCQCGVVAV